METKEGRAKIAFFLPSLEPGGAERNVVNLLKELDRENYEPSLVLAEKRGEFIKEVPKDVLIVDLNTSCSLWLFLKLRRYFQKEKPELFISTFPRFNIINLLAKIFSQTKTKIILTEQTTISLLSVTAKTWARRLMARFFLPFLVKFLYPQAKAIVCVSKGVAKDLIKIVPLENKIRVIYNPVVDTRIDKLTKTPVNHSWFSNPEIPVILAVGRLIKAKDYPNLLRAFNKVLEKREARLVILGKGPEKEKLKNMAQNLDISKNVAFLGFQKNPYKYMKRATVFALSSFREGFGHVIVEAMACGLPVVSTDCPSGPGEIIEQGKNGILVPVGDERILAEAILKVLNNSSLSQKLSQEGKKRAQYFSVERSCKEYEKLFQEILE